VHIVGIGAGGTGCFVSQRMLTPTNPFQYLKYTLYEAAAGVEDSAKCDVQYVERLVRLLKSQKPHGRALIFAFDQLHDETGRAVKEESEFYTPNDYVLSLAHMYPELFVACASIHPYRPDAVAALEKAVYGGAAAVKWLPNAMNINPADAKCDPFYEAMARLKVPLITHAGEEKAVHAEEMQRLGNPLHLRRPLEHGVTVVVAHCAALGENPDLDAGGSAPPFVENFALFLRLMGEEKWKERLFGDVSALTIVNRVGEPLKHVLRDGELQKRLINGSDYPLPAINVLMQTGVIASKGFLKPLERDLLNEIDQHDPYLFDFVMKRCLRWKENGQEYRFADEVFMVRPEVFPRLTV
jgi:mannonate dehydratase